MASEKPDWQIEAVDFSNEAVELAQSNAINLDLQQVNIYQSDWFSAIDDNKKFDLIVSNPPYISESEWNGLEPEVREHEPRQALVGGKDGLCFYRQIIQEAADWLMPDGYLIIETGETQAGTIIKLIQNELYYEDTEIIKDLQVKERVISAKRK